MGRKSSRPSRSDDDSESDRSFRTVESDASLDTVAESGQREINTESDAGSGSSLGGIGSSSERVQRIRENAADTEWSPGGVEPERLQRLRENAKASPSPMSTARTESTDAQRSAGTRLSQRGPGQRSLLQRSEQSGPSRAGDTGVPDTVRDVISSPGRSLDTSIQRAMEERMGDNLGDVRIHNGPQAAEACEDINARAFTVGNHVAFNTGEYDPSSAEGQHVLAHELAHVRQQTGGAVSMLPQPGELEIDPDERLEREAEETAQRVMEGGELGIQRLADTEVHIQRSRKNSGRTAVLASALDDTSALKEQVSSLQDQVSENSTAIESLSQTVDDALQTPDLSELEGEITTDDGGLADEALTHLTELTKAQAGLAGGAMTTAGVASANPVLAGAGLSLALGGPVGLNALEQEASTEESLDLSGEFLDPLADAVAKRLEEREIGTSSDPMEAQKQ